MRSPPQMVLLNDPTLTTVSAECRPARQANDGGALRLSMSRSAVVSSSLRISGADSSPSVRA